MIVSDGSCDHEPHYVLKHSVLSRLLNRLCHRWLGWPPLFFRELVNPYDLGKILDIVLDWKPDVILTVAHGHLWRAAMRVAEISNTPLISIYYDWWPELLDIPNWAKRYVSNQLFKLKDQSAAIECISQGMRSLLGEHHNSWLIYPVSETISQTAISQRDRNFNVANPRILRYLGNTGEYGDMLESAMTLLLANSSHRLEIGGSFPRWKKLSPDYVHSLNLVHGFIPSIELGEWLANCDFLLVLSSFSPSLAKFASTSLPSKISTYLQLGKPIIAWAPSYFALGQLFLSTQCGLLVDNPSPDALLSAINNFTEEMISYYSLRSYSVYTNLFSPNRLQHSFDTVITNSLKPSTN